MGVEVNQATGEVTGSVAGLPYKLHATLPRVADLQAALGVTGFGQMFGMVQSADARAIYHGLRLLRSSGDVKALDRLTLGTAVAEGVELLVAALSAGLPEGEPGKKGAAGENGTSSPGADTASSPSAS